MLQLKERFALRVLTDDRLVFFHVPPDDISAVEIAEQIILKDGLFRYAAAGESSRRHPCGLFQLRSETGQEHSR